MTEDEKIELMDDYLHERLTAQQRSDFQQELAFDPELKKELDIHEMLIKGIVLESKTSHFKKHLADLRKEAPVIPLHDLANKNNKKVTLWGWAAGLAAMLLTGFFYFWFTQNNLGETLYAKYYQPYPSGVLATITRGDTLRSLKQEAVQSYENREYKKAVPLLEEIVDQQIENEGWQLVLGICYLETNDFKLAERNLMKVVQSPDNLFYKQGQWYLAMTYLKQNKTVQAKLVLKLLGRETGIYSQKARQLLTEL